MILFIVMSILCSCSSDSNNLVVEAIENVNVRVNLTIDSETIEEGESATIMLSLDSPNITGGNLVFPFILGGTVDPSSDVVSLVSTNLTINPGDSETTLVLITIDDDDVEENEIFTLALGELPNSITEGTSTEVALRITDND